MAGLPNDDAPTCDVHTDTPLHATRSGWVCPNGCADWRAGRRYRDLLRLS